VVVLSLEEDATTGGRWSVVARARPSIALTWKQSAGVEDGNWGGVEMGVRGRGRLVGGVQLFVVVSSSSSVVMVVLLLLLG